MFLNHTLNALLDNSIKQEGGHKMPSDRESAEIKPSTATLYKEVPPMKLTYPACFLP